jgi:hypothetical protein
MRAVALGWIRDERDFDGLESLIAEINNDIRIAEEELAKPENQAWASNKFFAKL